MRPIRFIDVVISLLLIFAAIGLMALITHRAERANCEQRWADSGLKARYGRAGCQLQAPGGFWLPEKHAAQIIIRKQCEEEAQ